MDQLLPWLLRFDDLLEWSTEPRKTAYLLLDKGYNSETVKWKSCMGQSVGWKGTEHLCPPWVHHPPSNSLWSLTQNLCAPCHVELFTDVLFSSVQSLSHVRLFATPWIAACQASRSITNPQSLLKLLSIESVMPSSHLILSSPPLPSIFPSIRVFSMSQLFTWDGRSTGVSVSASVLPMNTQDWSPLGWTGWSSLQSKGLSRVFSNTIVQKHQFFGAQLSSRRSNWSNHWSLLINKSTALLPSQPSNHILVFLATTSQCCLGMSHCFRVLTKSLLTPTSMPKTFWQFWFLLQRLGFPSR